MKPTPRSQFLFCLGSIALLVGIVGDSFFHLSDPVTFAALGLAALFMLLGFLSARTQKSASELAPTPDQRHRRFIMLFPCIVAGVIFGFFLIRHDHPNFSLPTSILISCLTLVVATALLIWGVYFRHGRPQ